MWMKAAVLAAALGAASVDLAYAQTTWIESPTADIRPMRSLIFRATTWVCRKASPAHAVAAAADTRRRPIQDLGRNQPTSPPCKTRLKRGGLSRHQFLKEAPMRRIVFVCVAGAALAGVVRIWPPYRDRPMERPPRSSE